MNKLLKCLSLANASQRQLIPQHCNYKDNYYGDQVCVSTPIKKS